MTAETQNTAPEEKTESVETEKDTSQTSEQQEGSSQTPDSSSEATEQTAAGSESGSEPTEEEKNWKAFRDGRDSDRKAKEAAEQKASERQEQIDSMALAMAQMQAGQSPTNPPISQQVTEELLGQLQTDDIPTGGEIMQYFQKMLPEALEKHAAKSEEKRAKDRAEEDAKQMPAKIRAANRDFDEIVTKENLDYLDYHHPLIAKGLERQGHTLEKWNDVYAAVKKYVPQMEKRDVARMDHNANKPQHVSQANAGVSAESGMTRRLSESEKAANYKRLVALARGA